MFQALHTRCNHRTRVTRGESTGVSETWLCISLRDMMIVCVEYVITRTSTDQEGCARQQSTVARYVRDILQLLGSCKKATEISV